MKLSNTIWALPILAFIALPAAAGWGHGDGKHHGKYQRGHDRIERRLDRLDRRIEQGVRSGELTRREARRLNKGYRRVVRMERRFTRDGHLDRHERFALAEHLDGLSRKVYRLKHNDRVRHVRSRRDDGTRYFVDRGEYPAHKGFH